MSHSPNHGALEILVVEDEQASLEEMIEYLQMQGYVCHGAPNGDLALQFADRHSNIGVVVSDIRMPGMDGLELIERLKSKPSNGSEMEFVITTGFAGQDELKRSIALQVFDFIEKPVDLKQLSEVVWCAMERALSRRLEHQRNIAVEQKATKSHDQLDSALHALQSASKDMASHDAEILAERHRFRKFLEILRWGMNERLHNITSLLDTNVVENPADNPENRVAEEIAKLARLVNSIGDPISVGDKIKELKSGEFCLGELLTKVMSSHAANARERGVKINYQPVQFKDRITGRPHLVAEAIGNIVANAIDYTPRFHEVTVGLTHSSNNLMVTVQDEGLGMSSEAMEFVFAPLQSVARPVGRARKGLGLGLTISRLIVELHGGEISITSEESAGTKVVITLPTSTNPTIV